MLPPDPERGDSSSGEESNNPIEIPSFASGGRVDETGLALVHEGEWIMPAPGSEAVISPDSFEAEVARVVNYYFPVEIEVVGTLSQEEVERVANYVFAALETELSSRI